MREESYDIIGDIHGQADALRQMLTKLGYSEREGSFQHADRKAIFVGDFIDRGPKQIEVIKIVRAMCENETAVAILGNHEFNAIGWVMPDGNGDFLRPHSDKNKTQHGEFLRQIGEGSTEHQDAIDWFRSLPVWVELEGFRVVHACWHDDSLNALDPHIDSQSRLTKEGLNEALTRGSDAYEAAEILLKGPEAKLPAGISFLDRDGNRRTEVRLSWWENKATTFREAAYQMEDIQGDIPDTKLPVDFRYRESTPVFFGHYWMKRDPEITSPNAVCLDFRLEKEGCLTAYRWNGESKLSEDCLICVPTRSQKKGE
jgi:diadenosine tetraphosphatase ApaH/serine/threonine PP2A family protein phosphatase